MGTEPIIFVSSLCPSKKNNARNNRFESPSSNIQFLYTKKKLNSDFRRDRCKKQEKSAT